MECLRPVFDFWLLSEWSKRTHLSYHNEIRPIVLSIDPLERSFRNRHAIVFSLLREHGSHPGAGVIRFQRPDGGPLRPVWVSEESSSE